MFKKKKNKLLLLPLIYNLVFVPLSHSEWFSLNGITEGEEPSVKVLVSNEFETVIEISIPGLSITNINKGMDFYQKLELPGYFTTQDIGKPQIPVISELLVVPDMVNIKGAIIDSSLTKLENINVFPFQKPVKGIVEEPFFIDLSYYAKDELYPASSIDVKGKRRWRDLRITPIKIKPIKYNPAKKELIVYKKMIVRFEYNKDYTISEAYVPQRSISDLWDKISGVQLSIMNSGKIEHY